MDCIICKRHRPYNLDPHIPLETCIMYGGESGAGGHVAKSFVPYNYRLNLHQDLDYLPDVFQKYIDSFIKIINGEQVKNLYLWSRGTGLGKTFTASALLNEFNLFYVLMSWMNGQDVDTPPAYFLDLTELQGLYNGFNRPNVDKESAQRMANMYYERLERAQKAMMTVIDDVGVRDVTEGFRADIHTLINRRTLGQTPTIYTSNHPIEDLEHLYDKRMYDRIRDNTVVISFDAVGESRRGL